MTFYLKNKKMFFYNHKVIIFVESISLPFSKPKLEKKTSNSSQNMNTNSPPKLSFKRPPPTLVFDEVIAFYFNTQYFCFGSASGNQIYQKLRTVNFWHTQKKPT